ncbi:MAG: hypothetical protein Q8P82_01910, partial [bacterium]|nr:hypothetical protein [bacterium]
MASNSSKRRRNRQQNHGGHWTVAAQAVDVFLRQIPIGSQLPITRNELRVLGRAAQIPERSFLGDAIRTGIFSFANDCHPESVRRPSVVLAQLFGVFGKCCGIESEDPTQFSPEFMAQIGLLLPWYIDASAETNEDRLSSEELVFYGCGFVSL